MGLDGRFSGTCTSSNMTPTGYGIAQVAGFPRYLKFTVATPPGEPRTGLGKVASRAWTVCETFQRAARPPGVSAWLCFDSARGSGFDAKRFREGRAGVSSCARMSRHYGVWSVSSVESINVRRELESLFKRTPTPSAGAAATTGIGASPVQGRAAYAETQAYVEKVRALHRVPQHCARADETADSTLEVKSRGRLVAEGTRIELLRARDQDAIKGSVTTGSGSTFCAGHAQGSTSTTCRPSLVFMLQQQQASVRTLFTCEASPMS